MANIILLHGGPWHGRIVTLEDGHNHFHIIEPVEEAVDRALKEPMAPEEGFQTLPVHEGIYSQVAGRLHDFEWDGWRSHE